MSSITTTSTRTLDFVDVLFLEYLHHSLVEVNSAALQGPEDHCLPLFRLFEEGFLLQPACQTHIRIVPLCERVRISTEQQQLDSQHGWHGGVACVLSPESVPCWRLQ